MPVEEGESEPRLMESYHTECQYTRGKLHPPDTPFSVMTRSGFRAMMSPHSFSTYSSSCWRSLPKSISPIISMLVWKAGKEGGKGGRKKEKERGGGKGYVK